MEFHRSVCYAAASKIPWDTPMTRFRHFLIILSLPLFALAGGCAPAPPSAPRPSPQVESHAVAAENLELPESAAGDPIGDLLGSEVGTPLESMGYTIQVGAFSNLDNAVRLEQLLEKRGIDAYYFRHESGLYKVRFGSHKTYAAARGEAERLQKQNLVGSFYIVAPEEFAAARIKESGRGDLRAELVKTARQFLGIPYRWGGVTTDDGFDCSGLTMVCYRLNGLNLPRNSRTQFDAGRRVKKEALRPGDLVFFATKGGSRVTHVGLYIGDNRFIHAPRTGKTVRSESLAQPFFARTFVGARSYL